MIHPSELYKNDESGFLIFLFFLRSVDVPIYLLRCMADLMPKIMDWSVSVLEKNCHDKNGRNLPNGLTTNQTQNHTYWVLLLF